MTPGSNHTLPVSQRGILQGFRQLKTRSEKNGSVSAPNPKNQRHPKAAWTPRSCLKIRLKDRTRMEQREPQEDSVPESSEGSEGRLRELTSRWFIQTQVPHIVRNGIFPVWFLGFISRRDAEEILREKELGCFLIRLSDKSIGYILSYRGSDRCRHFVINQSPSGEFVVCGDTEGHGTLSDLIEYFKINPFEPFGEHLTYSCFEELNEELYDTIRLTPKEKHEVRDGAVQKQQSNTSSERLPARPPRSSRTPEVIPPLPRRGKPAESGPLNDQDVLYARLQKPLSKAKHDCQDRAERSAAAQTGHRENISRRHPESGSDLVYSELSLLDFKSRSMPLLDNSSDEKQSYQLSASCPTPPKLSPKPIRQTASSAASPHSRPRSIHSLDHLCNSQVYHLAGSPGGSQVAPAANFPPDDTYELIPGHKGPDRPEPTGDTYEPLEDFRPKHILSSWGIKTEKWKRLFPEVKRK
ncbi:uncharacterized protein LOC142989396 [Genypterus blacodes]|uniref:uncharacterized protein LOC142989396 n=1 Tax=Genypterus blacodes TaxID=154954 RepID=UPI003F7613DF